MKLKVEKQANFFYKQSMFKTKYQILIFKDDKKGSPKTTYVPCWLLILPLILIPLLIGISLYFFYQNNDLKQFKKLYAITQAKLNQRDRELLLLTQQLQTIKADLLQVKELDQKIRIMMNLDNSSNGLTSIGGIEPALCPDSGVIAHPKTLVKQMQAFLNKLLHETKLTQVQEKKLLSLLKDKQQILASTPSIWPTQGWLASKFGWRISPITGQKEFHKGLDIAGPIGTPIIAPADGTVSFVGHYGRYGLCIDIDHGNGIVTRYGHLKRVVVKKGEHVKRGQIIAYMGNSGSSTGPHLHYEVRLNGIPTNPMRYILN